MAVDPYGHWYEDEYYGSAPIYGGESLPPDPTAPPPATPGGGAGQPPPPSTPPASADPWATPPADGNWQAWFLQNVQSLPPNSQSLVSLEPKLQKHGIQVMRNASGVAGKIRLPTGQVVDVGRAFSSGNPGEMAWQWGIGGEGGGGPQMSIDPSFLTPWEGTPPGIGGIGPFEPPPDFKAPTAEELYEDPSYQFRLDQGKGVIENSAAARGVLNTGGNLHDLLSYGQKMGSQEYDAVHNRRFNVWNSDYRNRLDAYGMNSSRDNEQFSRLWQRYLDAKDTWYRNQNEPWRKLYDAATLGAGTAGA